MIKKLLLILLAVMLSGQTLKRDEYFKAFMMSGGAFDTRVGVIITNDTLKAVAMMREVQPNAGITIVDFRVRGICFTNPDYPTVMWISKIPESIEEVSVLNHELFHLTRDILEWAGVGLDDSTEEVYGYMLGYLTKQFYENIIRQ